MNASTGEIRIQGIDQPIRPFMSIGQFKGSSLAQHAHETWTIDRNVERQFVLGRPCMIDGMNFTVFLAFQQERLHAVMLSHTRSKPPRNWLSRLLRQILPPRRELPSLQAKALHDQWLRAVVGQEEDSQSYPWGSVSSIYNATLDGSSIEIRYF